MGINKDWGRISVTQAVAPAVHTATATQAAGIDTALYRKLVVVLDYGVVTDGTWTTTITTSATVGGSYVADDGLVTGEAFTVVTSTEDAQVYEVAIDLDALDNRWLKVVQTETVASASSLFGITLVGELKEA
tara:strand:- start:307 stop:702 length:396 start_codon:yes stop_codon:yes gene_type:complete